MSRSGYDDYDGDYSEWAYIRWRGAVNSAIKGRRGQAFLREMLAALDALPNKRLIREDLIKEGEVCAIGAVALSRGADVANIDPEDRETVANTFGIAPAMAAEIVHTNDDDYRTATPEARWEKMHAWVAAQIKKS